jgi:hypothetical protein
MKLMSKLRRAGTSGQIMKDVICKELGEVTLAMLKTRLRRLVPRGRPERLAEARKVFRRMLCVKLSRELFNYLSHICNCSSSLLRKKGHRVLLTRRIACRIPDHLFSNSNLFSSLLKKRYYFLPTIVVTYCRLNYLFCDLNISTLLKDCLHVLYVEASSKLANY